MGLTVSDVMRIVLTRVADEGALRFEIKLSKPTRETLRSSARGKGVHRPKDSNELFAQLGI